MPADGADHCWRNQPMGRTGMHSQGASVSVRAKKQCTRVRRFTTSVYIVIALYYRLLVHIHIHINVNCLVGQKNDS